MRWAWLALLADDASHPAPDLGASAEIGGRGGFHLLAWAAGRRPHADAVRIDASLLNREGDAATVIWQWLAPPQAPLFDDPAVQALTRRLAGRDLRGRIPDGVTTFTRDPVHYAGGMTVHRDQRSAGEVARDSWLRRVGPVQHLSVSAGLLGRTDPRPGPGTQRYSGQPWPLTRFAARPPALG